MADSDDKTNQFLNPKSMLTPGGCGAVVMLITNTLGTAFNLHGNTRMWMCLGLSFLTGTLVFAAALKSLWQKTVLYFLNSLIIFSMGAGVNSATQTVAASGSGNTESAPPPPTTNAAPPPQPGPGHHLPPMTNFPVMTPGHTNKPPVHPIQPAVIRQRQFLEYWH